MEQIFETGGSKVIAGLLQCAPTCERCAMLCLHEADVKSTTRCIQLNYDCAEICMQGTRLWRRNSAVASDYLLRERICRLCADLFHEHPGSQS